MQLSRRTLLSVLGVGVVSAFAAALHFNKNKVVQGYLKKYALAGNKYVFSKTPFHCHECFTGSHDELMVVKLQGSAPALATKVVGVLSPAIPSGYALVLIKTA